VSEDREKIRPFLEFSLKSTSSLISIVLITYRTEKLIFGNKEEHNEF